MTEMKNEMKKMLAAATATTAAVANSGTGREATAGVGGRCKPRSDLPLCPHCKKNINNKPKDCFLLPANADKKPANFIDGRFVNEKKVK